MNYGDLPVKYSGPETSRIVILPVAYDETSTWVKGSDKGPEAIMEASANLEFYDIETDSEVYRKGIYTDKPVACKCPPEKMAKMVEERVRGHIRKKKFVVVVGGEHSVSIGSMKAHADYYKGLSILQLDAHSDLRDSYQDSRYNHACVMARAKEISPIVQVGIRSMDSSEIKNMDRKRVVFADDIRKNREWIRDVVRLLSDRVYMTIDLDVLDSAFMPSTGTPEPGGLSWYDLLDLVKSVMQKRELVGFDVVELCPQPQNKAPDLLAAKLIYKILSYKFKS